MCRKAFLLIFLLIGTLNASLLFDKIENIIGKKQFQIHNKLIEVLFKDKTNFYITDNILNYSIVLQTLKDNGLLHLKFGEPKELKVEFKSNTDAIKTLKILNETLRGMGYHYYFTKESSLDKQSGILTWTIIFKTEYILDPFILVQELKSKACKISDVTRVTDDFWKYDIDVSFAKIKEAIKIDNNEKVIFQKPLRAYLIEVTNASKLQVISRNLNHWFPYIAFYNTHLNVLKVIKKNRIYKGYRTNVPRETKYIKITDLYTLINIKRGLSIIVK